MALSSIHIDLHPFQSLVTGNCSAQQARHKGDEISSSGPEPCPNPPEIHLGRQESKVQGLGVAPGHRHS